MPAQRIVDVVIGAFVDVLPERVVRGANGANTTTVIAGVNPDTKRQYVYYGTLGGGFGGRATKDGKDGVQVHITNTSNLPVEAIETEYPLIVGAMSSPRTQAGRGATAEVLGLRRVNQAGVAFRYIQRIWRALRHRAMGCISEETRGDLVSSPSSPRLEFPSGR